MTGPPLFASPTTGADGAGAALTAGATSRPATLASPAVSASRPSLPSGRRGDAVSGGAFRIDGPLEKRAWRTTRGRQTPRWARQNLRGVRSGYAERDSGNGRAGRGGGRASRCPSTVGRWPAGAPP